MQSEEDIMAEKSQETLMQEVIDREAIRTWPVRYCHGVGQKDVGGYVNLFPEDGSCSTDDPTLPGAQRREGLRQMIRGGWTRRRRDRSFITTGLNASARTESKGRALWKCACYVRGRNG
jgi:hypothetical protein